MQFDLLQRSFSSRVPLFLYIRGKMATAIAICDDMILITRLLKWIYYNN